MSKKEKILLLILAGVNFVNIMDFMIIIPLQEYLVPVFHVTPQQFSFLVSSYGITACISGLVASFFVDRFDRKKVLLFVFTGLILGTFACGFARSYNELLAARIIAGAFGGLIGAQVLSIIGDVFSYEWRGRASGMLMMAFALASIAGVPLGLYIATLKGWQVPFISIGILGTAMLLLMFLRIPSMKLHIEKRIKGSSFALYTAFTDKNQFAALLMMFTLILSHFSIIPFIAPYLETNVGFTKEQISLMYFIGGAVSMVSSPLIGKMADKFGKQKIFSIFLLLAIIPVILITNMPRIPYYYVLVVTALFFIFAGGRMVPAQALMTSVVDPKQRGGFMNVNSSLQQLGIGLAAFMAGSIVTKSKANELVNYQYVGYIGIAVSILCLYLVTRIKPLDVQQKENLNVN